MGANVGRGAVGVGSGEEEVEEVGEEEGPEQGVDEASVEVGKQDGEGEFVPEHGEGL